MRTYILTATKAILVVSISLLIMAGSTLQAQPGTVLAHQKISDTAGGFTGTLDDGDNFGY